MVKMAIIRKTVIKIKKLIRVVQNYFVRDE